VGGRGVAERGDRDARALGGAAVHAYGDARAPQLWRAPSLGGPQCLGRTHSDGGGRARRAGTGRTGQRGVVVVVLLVVAAVPSAQLAGALALAAAVATLVVVVVVVVVAVDLHRRRRALARRLLLPLALFADRLSGWRAGARGVGRGGVRRRATQTQQPGARAAARYAARRPRRRKGEAKAKAHSTFGHAAAAPWPRGPAAAAGSWRRSTCRGCPAAAPVSARLRGAGRVAAWAADRRRRAARRRAAAGAAAAASVPGACLRSPGSPASLRNCGARRGAACGQAEPSQRGAHLQTPRPAAPPPPRHQRRSRGRSHSRPSSRRRCIRMVA
jgi:hypothetical protein